jgi:hypothetical protein
MHERNSAPPAPQNMLDQGCLPTPANWNRNIRAVPKLFVPKVGLEPTTPRL